MKLRLKIIECIQGISIIAIILSGTLILGGSEYQEEWNNFIWQFRTGIGYILISLIVIGCMELLKRYEKYRMYKKFRDAIRKSEQMSKVFESIEKAQQRSGNSKLGALK